MEDIKEEKNTLNQQDQHTYELTETEAACTGSACCMYYADIPWDPKVERRSGNVPILNSEATYN